MYVSLKICHSTKCMLPPCSYARIQITLQIAMSAMYSKYPWMQAWGMLIVHIKVKWITDGMEYADSQSNEHFFCFLTSGGSRAARMASSKTFFKPFCVRAEHSTYLTALSSLASFSPCSKVIAFCFVLASFSIVAASSLKSIWVPTRRKGVLGQWWVISGTHCKGRRGVSQFGVCRAY